MIRTQIYIPDDLHRELVLFAKRDNVNVSQLLREGARELLKKKKTKKRAASPLAGIVGIYKGKVKTNAVEVIRDYYKHDVV